MPPKSVSGIEQLIKNQQIIQKQMAAMLAIFERSNVSINTLIKGFTAEQASAAATLIPLTPGAKAVAIALRTLSAQEIHIVPRQWLAIVARFSPKSSAYRSSLALLIKRKMLLKVPGGAGVRATETLEAPSGPEPPLDWSELMKRFAKHYSRPEVDILYHLMIQAYDFPENQLLDRKTLAERVGVATSESSSFRNRLTGLESAGFVEYGPESTVRANIHWFQKR